ncbi:MAG: type II secretion system protein [Eubacterium sp.]
MQFINKLKKNQKGFTLVELIVVLVILAILAAFTIPAMLGFVNDAKGKAYIAEAREVYMAYQSAASEFAGDLDAVADGKYTQAAPGAGTKSAAVQKSALNKLVGDLVKIDDKGAVTINGTQKWQVTILSGKVTEVLYEKGGYLIKINYTATGGGTAEIEKGGTIK